MLVGATVVVVVVVVVVQGGERGKKGVYFRLFHGESFVHLLVYLYTALEVSTVL